MDIRVNVKHMGRRRKSVEPVVCRLFTAPSTVRELILAVVEAGVRDYNDKLKDGDLQEVLRCLTRQEIEDKAETGKVAFGVLYGEKEADLKEACDNAIQCFEDGIYRIFLDDRPLLDLEEDIGGETDGMFTFVRLTMLSGRMW
ncbi:MAG: hypothetical protein HFG74_04230 [Hungatella sp.]|jgi:hypothetical protein|nr:hypothetical protein [Hungatella sp.]